MDLSKLVYHEGTRYFLYNYSNNIYRFCVVKNYRKPKQELKVDYNSDENKRIAKSRAIRTIKEYAMCNDFEYFITLTVSSSSCDRFSLDECQSKMKKMFKAYKRKNKNFAYLIVTEQHKDRGFPFPWSC